MKNLNKKIIAKAILLILIFLSTTVNAQKTSEEYWAALGPAITFYENAQYQEAAHAFKNLWLQPNDASEIANHRLYAAAANCMIDNEEGTRENLFKIVAVANKRDMKRVLINYEIFNKYKSTVWWKDLEIKFDERLNALIDHHKNLRIFRKGRDLKYNALRITPNGDTVANTFITIIPQGTGWGDEAADSQSEVIFKYEFTTQDSLDHISELDSISDKKFWERLDTTGIIEKKNLVFIHPFRNNEFFKTEIAPFPSVKLPITKENLDQLKSTTHIMGNWGTYSYTNTKESYELIGKRIIMLEKVGELECYEIRGIGLNSKHGKSVLNFYFNEEYGFTEMNYLTYDGDKIFFKLVEIIEH